MCVSQSSVSVDSVFPLHACQTWINLTSSPFLQVYQILRRSLSAYGLSLSLASSHSAIIFCHKILSLGLSLPPLIMSLTLMPPYIQTSAVTVSRQRPPLRSPSASRSRASPQPPPCHPCLRLPSGGRPLHHRRSRHVYGNYTRARQCRQRHEIAPSADTCASAADSSNGTPSACAGMPDLTRTRTRVLTSFFPMQPTSFFELHIVLCYTTVIKLFVALWVHLLSCSSLVVLTW